MSRQLFGTDGIRGVAGEYPLDARTVFAFGRALAEWAKSHAAEPRVLIGMDTRESGPALAAQVIAGLASDGVQCTVAGVVPTPGVAWLTRNGPYAAGLVISASHNPFQDNGLKLFAHSGYKVPDAEEVELERRIFALAADSTPTIGHISTQPAEAEAYVDFLRSICTQSLSGLKIVVDAGNGAASAYAPRILRSLGAEVVELYCSPNGRNINLNCGALHSERIQDAVVAHSASLAVAFDGDADRVIFAARSGRKVDGDHVLLICGRDAKNRGKLPGDIVVATVMSNLGLEIALKNHGIRLVRTAVGDKYVLEEMIRIGASIGGEQSGHVIFHEQATTGDGMLTMLRLVEIMARLQTSLDELAAELHVLPQTLVNVRFGQKRPLEGLDSVQAAIRDCQAEFGDAGRVVVRFSGTEPLARVMVEGTTLDRVGHHAETIAKAIQQELRA
ncbi:MAG: phosphoglucosamine mutase [Acidobacteria bacterium]|nr:phosphoglucosamine mutase [Acidobacteriota bacterium]